MTLEGRQHPDRDAQFRYIARSSEPELLDGLDAREALKDLGYDVLPTAVPRLEVYAQSFGMPVPDTGREVWRRVARDLTGRCAPPCPVRS